jgi:hypothetical protein
MNNKNILDKIKDELIDYNYTEDILNIPIGCHLKYVSKKNFIKKSGILKEIKDETILELRVFKTRWFIYTDKYYIFYKKIVKNKFKKILEDLVKNDFKIIKN